MYWLLGLLGLLFIFYIYLVFIAPYLVREKHYFIHKNSNELVDISKAYDVFDFSSIVTIAHFSDTHFSKHFQPKRINRLIRSTQRVKPSIIIFTGDLIEDYAKWSPKHSQKLISKLNHFSAPLGKIAVLGNHDYKNDGQYFVQNIYQQADFTLLKNEEIFGSMDQFSITISGMDDYLVGKPQFTFEKTFSKWQILLVHEPDAVMKVPNLSHYDLVLTGHAHQKRKWFNRFKKPIKGAEFFTHGLYVLTPKTILSICNRARRSFLGSRFRLVPEIIYYHLAKENTEDQPISQT